jgi:BTB/POZ domain
MARTSFATSGIIIVYVGAEQRAYRIHKHLLISKCPYFRASLSSGFPEGRTNKVYLSEDEPEAVDVFVQWLYSGSFSPTRNAKDVGVKTRAYIMADAFLMVDFKTELMDSIRQFYTWNWMGSEILTMLAEHDAFHGPLKCFALDQLAYDLLSFDDHPQESRLYSPGGEKRGGIDAFLAEGASAANEMFWTLHKVALEPSGNPSLREGCHYHDHAAGSPGCNLPMRRMWKRTVRRA